MTKRAHIKQGLFALIAFVLLAVSGAKVEAQQTSLTYQGRLDSNGDPVGGTYELQFTIYGSSLSNDVVAGPVTNVVLLASNRLFGVTLDFGPGIFTGADRWLEIAVRTNGAAASTVLSPRQRVTAAPYAVTAGNLSGPLPAISGANLTNLNGGSIQQGTVTSNQIAGATDYAYRATDTNTVRAIMDARFVANLSGYATNLTLDGIVGDTNAIYIAGAGIADANGIYYLGGATNFGGLSPNPVPYWTNGNASGYLIVFDPDQNVAINYSLGTLLNFTVDSAFPYFSDSTNISGAWEGSGIVPDVHYFGRPALVLRGPVLGDGRGLTNLFASSITGPIPADVIGPINSNNIPFAGLTMGNLDYGLWLASTLAMERGQTYLNRNRFSWKNVTACIRAGRSFTTLRIGDGLASHPGQMLEAAALNNWTNIFPFAGFKGTHAPQWNISVSGAAALIGAQQSDLWYKQWGIITDQNGTVAFGNSIPPGGVVGNVGALCYVAEPNAGHFQVQTQINGGTWTAVSALTNIDASSATMLGRVVAWTNSFPAVTQIRAVGVDPGRSVKIMDASIFDTTISNGIMTVDWVPYNGPGSATLKQILTANPAVTAPIFRWWDPTLILFQKIGLNGNAPDDLTNFLQLVQFWKTNTPNSDAVFCGIYPVGGGVTAIVQNDNAYQRTNVVNYGYSYFDGETPFGDVTNMLHRGFINGDQIHASYSGYAAYDVLLTEWLSLGELTAGSPVPIACFIHKANSSNTPASGNKTYLDNPACNANPKAILTVTQNWSGGDGVGSTKQAGVLYDAAAARWAIFIVDGSAMPLGVAYNVQVTTP